MAKPNLVLTILYVRDLSAAAAFYDDVFAWEKSVDEPVYVEYAVGTGVRLGLMPQSHTKAFLGPDLGERAYAGECPRAEIYLQFFECGPVIDRLEAKGATCVSPLADRDWGDRVAYYLDGDGYVIAIAEPIR